MLQYIRQNYKNNLKSGLKFIIFQYLMSGITSNWKQIGLKKSNDDSFRSQSPRTQRIQKFSPQSKIKRQPSQEKFFKVNLVGNNDRSFHLKQNQSSSDQLLITMGISSSKSKIQGVPLKSPRLSNNQQSILHNFGSKDIKLDKQEQFGTAKSKFLYDLQRQYNKFKEQIEKQLKLMKEKMNSIINHVLTQFEKEVYEYQKKLLEMHEQNIEKLNFQYESRKMSYQQKQPLSDRIQSFASQNSRSSKQMTSQAQTHYNESNSASERKFKLNFHGGNPNKHNFNKFLEAIQKLKGQMDQMHIIHHTSQNMKITNSVH